MQQPSSFRRKTLFETKSAKVNSVQIRANLICAGLDNGVVQMWRLPTGKAQEPSNPEFVFRVRHSPLPVWGVDINRHRSLFASCGDDHKIKLWESSTDSNTNNTQPQEKSHIACCSGHSDAVRSVRFYSGMDVQRQSWLVSSSDDRTVRVWSYLIATLDVQCLHIFGHNDRVTSAVFCPNDDSLIVSSSLDHTIRVWDTNFAVVKFWLEGHTAGVTSVSVHPSLPLLISAGNDRQVKLWRMSETKAWEVDTLIGHSSNVSDCYFDQWTDTAFSSDENGNIRIWDVSRRIGLEAFGDGVPVRSIASEVNQTKSIIVAARDSGLLVFEIETKTKTQDKEQKVTADVYCQQQQKHWSEFHEKRKSLSVEELNSAPWNTGPDFKPKPESELAPCVSIIEMPCGPVIERDLDYDEFGIRVMEERIQRRIQLRNFQKRISLVLAMVFVLIEFLLLYLVFVDSAIWAVFGVVCGFIALRCRKDGLIERLSQQVCSEAEMIELV